jgi:hypothetical protein
LLNTIAATATLSYLASRVSSVRVVTAGTVHGYAVASGWAAGVLVLAAVVGGGLINAHPGRERAHPDATRSPVES